MLHLSLCDAGYVGFTRRHLHQRVDEHRHTSSSIGKHFRDKHSSTPKDLTSILPSSKNATASLTASSIRCFLLTNWDQVLMYNVTQFVQKFLNSFVFIVFNSPLFNIFMLSTFVTSLFYNIISTYVNFYLHFAWQWPSLSYPDSF